MKICSLDMFRNTHHKVFKYYQLTGFNEKNVIKKDKWTFEVYSSSNKTVFIMVQNTKLQDDKCFIINHERLFEYIRLDKVLLNVNYEGILHFNAKPEFK